MHLNKCRFKNFVLVAVVIAISVSTAVLSTFACFAADTRYTISELDDMIITLPEDMTAVTRSSKKSDKYFSVFGLDYDSTMANFKSGNIYLQGMDSNASVTVTVTMTQTDESKAIKNYNLLDSEKLSEVTGNFLSQPEYSSCTSDQTGGIVWLTFNTDVTENSAAIKAYQAHTVYDGMSINFTLQRNGGNVNSSDFQTFSQIVSSIAFLKGDGSSGLAIDKIVYIILFSFAAAAALTILITVTAKALSKRKKHDKNHKIIKELADKYSVDENVKEYKQIFDEEEPEHQSQDSYEEPEENVGNEYFSEIPFESYKAEKEEMPDEIEEIADDENDDEKILDKAEDMDDFYENDEELIRQAAKTKFDDSDDFFEEAPKKTKGVIKEEYLKDAEDFDVIKEVEKKVQQVERKEPKKKKSKNAGQALLAGLMAFGGGIKYFGVHMGYFCTNVYRMIKHKRVMKKRRKAEQERRERQRMREARARQQQRSLNSGELVQVRSRTDRRPTQNRRPQQGKRPPQNRRPR